MQHQKIIPFGIFVQLINYIKIMLEEKAGVLAGKVWEILNAKGALTEKEIMKEMKTRKAKEFYLAIGGLLREGKLNCTGEEDNIVFELK